MKRTALALLAVFAAASARATVVGSTNDFISPLWKVHYGSRWTLSSNVLVSADWDADGDGAGILDEFRAGTSPAVGAVPSATGDGWLDERPQPFIVADVVYAGPTAVKGLHFDLVSKETGMTLARYDVRHGAKHALKIPADAPGRRTFATVVGPVLPGSVSIAEAGGTSGATTDRLATWPKGELRLQDGTIGSIDYASGRVDVDLSRVKSSRPKREIVLSWTESFRGLDENGRARAVLSTPYEGHASPGSHVLVCYADDGGAKKWTAGAPYGCADVDVGFAGASVAVPLSDTHPSIMRIDLASAVQNNTLDGQQGLNDRGVRGCIATNKGATAGTDMPSATAKTRVRVLRSEINGLAGRTTNASTYYPVATVLDRYVDLSADPLITERYFFSGGIMDLDWGCLEAPATSLGISFANITRAGYRVVLGEGSVSATVTNNNLATLFVNVFESGNAGYQTACVPIYPSGAIGSGRPTFRWTHKSSVKSYPAFELRVWSGSTVVYDSGVLRAPPREADGSYRWSPPGLFAAGLTPKGFSFSGSFTWSVSMLDAKFTTPNTTETKLAFSVLNATNPDQGKTRVYVGGYSGSVNPVDRSSSGTTNNVVRIEASNLPDFSHLCASKFLSSVSGIGDDLSTNSPSCLLQGLPAGVPIYVRAFVDVNGDGSPTAGEPLGLFCGEDMLPRSVTPAAGEEATVDIRLYDTVP